MLHIGVFVPFDLNDLPWHLRYVNGELTVCYELIMLTLASLLKPNALKSLLCMIKVVVSAISCALSPYSQLCHNQNRLEVERKLQYPTYS
jgi:hypothetical protein